MKNPLVTFICTTLAAAVAATAVQVAWPSDAEAQGRALRRAIQKNTQLAVRRQLAKLNIRGSAGAVTAMNISPDGR